MAEDKPVLVPLNFPSLSSCSRSNQGTIAATRDDGVADDGDDGVQEWAMIEINGELLRPADLSIPSQEAETTTKESSLQEEGGSVSLSMAQHVELGSLWFDKHDETPHMIIGSHELKGKVETLKQPLCVLEKQRHLPQEYGDSSPFHDYPQKNDATLITSSYIIKGLITRKLLFQQYPKTILRSSATSSSFS
ncbi:hypothetical protein ACA910_011763 [Epithemia clementina (nom. ined.)]